MEFKDILFGLILFVAFASLVITPIVLLSNNYNKDMSGIANGSLNIESFDDSFEDVASSTETYRQRYSSATDKAEEGEKEETGWSLFGIISDTVSLITVPFSLLAIVLSGLLHIPTAYISVGLGILGLTIILSLWKIWKQGT